MKTPVPAPPAHAVPARELPMGTGRVASPAPSATQDMQKACAMEVRGLVRWAVDRRQEAMKYGWSRMPHPTMVAMVGRLEVWLRVNLHPSAETLLRFWAEQGNTVRYVMPSTAAGRQRLDRLEELMTQLGRG